ncbi:MAG: hypothetical protein HDT47_01020 [Ruminococcaceae bacterium]|nr:hypothetical protein [Oscillospiraceae bacterium]
MSTNRIIIPFTVKAHLVCNTYADTYRPPRWYPDYTKVYNSVLGSKVTPAPFTEYGSCLKAGAHLHFILPSAFRHGAAEKNQYTFPTVPNRYVVTRMYEKDKKIQVKSFVVESDFIKAKLDEGEDKEDYSVIPYLDDSAHPYRFIGRRYEAGNAPKGGEYLSESLTAVAGGDPMFAAYYPTCRSVFGLYDPLKDVPADCMLTYFVLGYFGRETDDPFSKVENAEDFKKVLTEYNFDVDGEYICDSCVLFGEALNIEWKGADHHYPDMDPPDGDIDVSFGAASAEAISAVLAQKIDNGNNDARTETIWEYNITKLQYDLIKQQNLEDGSFKTDDEMYKRTFRETDPLEKYDELILKEKCSDGVLPDLEEYWELRRLQREAGRIERKLSFTRKKLYYAWETYISRREAHQANLSEAQRELEGLLEHLSDNGSLVSEKNRLKNEIALKRREVKKKLPTQYSLKTENAAPFAVRKDPVVMVSGKGINNVFLFDDKTVGGKLPCYVSPKTLKDLSIESVLEKCSGLPPEFLPFDYNSLLYQAVINSPSLLKIFGSFDTEEKPLYGAVNEKPLELSQLFMDWQTDCDCTEDKAELENWSFDFGNTNYTYHGGKAEKYVSVSGRIPLTPHAHKVLTDRLNAYQTLFPDLKEKAHDLPFISQELSGFTNELTGLRQVFQLPVDYDTHEISQKVSKLVEKNRLSVGGTELFPMRGGYISLSKLNIIGTFGQKQSVVQKDAHSIPKAFFPYYMQVSENGTRGLFPISFTSESRLTAEFIPPDFADLKNGGSPICAFILPELLNRRLILYNEKGEYAGMLKTVYRNGKSENRYVPPASPVNLNPVLKGFTEGITGSAAALPSLLCLIESKLNNTLRTCRRDFIWGVPLTLAQLRVCFEFFGGAEYSKTDGDFGKYDDKGAEKLKIPLKFGNIERVTDGAAGVYESGDYSGIYPMWNDDGKLCGEYIKENSPCISAAEGDRFFTVLSVPDSDLHIETGLLPVVKTRINSMYTSFLQNIIPTAEINPIIANFDRIRLPLYDGLEWRYKQSPEKEDTVYKIFPTEDIMAKSFISDGFVSKTTGKDNNES